jgi:predicted metal-dependent phosphoesterase TrpH
MHFTNMTTEERAALLSELTFDSILDETCERLLDRQAKYSIQRIQEMEKHLESLEKELNEFLRKNR